MRRTITLGILAAALLPALSATADEAPKPDDPTDAQPEDGMKPDLMRVGIQVSGGAAGFLGDLTDAPPVPVLDVQIKTLYQRHFQDRLRFYLAIDVLFTQVDHGTGGPFPFADEQRLTVLGFLFVPMACGHPGPVQFCGGIGQGTVNVNGGEDRRDYGTWNYQAQLDVFPLPRFSVHVLGKFVGQVEQVVGGAESEFGFGVLAGGASFVF